MFDWKHSNEFERSKKNKKKGRVYNMNNKGDGPCNKKVINVPINERRFMN